MKVITQSQFIALLQGHYGALFLGVETETAPDMRLKNNPHRDALKRCEGILTTGGSYGAAVPREGTRQAVDASAFVPGPLPRKDDEWLLVNKVIYNPRLEQFYLRTQSTPGQRDNVQLRRVGYYTPSGEAIADDILAPFIREPKESKRQQESGLEETVWVRDWKFESIKSFTLDGIKYLLVKSESVNEVMAAISEYDWRKSQIAEQKSQRRVLSEISA